MNIDERSDVTSRLILPRFDRPLIRIRTMKILVAIANYGTKNMGHLNTLIQEYRSMPHDVDIVVLSNVPKNLGPDIEVIAGLPTKDPWSLPFGHKTLFAERADDYDLFIYSEDDTLITEQNIRAFLDVTNVLPKREIAGFMRYEVDSSGQKYYSTVHSHFHWVPDSITSIGSYKFARFTNDHSACYLLTQEQLKKAIDSGGYLVGPHQGRYDLLCTAATDPYTQCGFAKVICISHVQDFMTHHLPNIYIGKLGLESSEFHRQIDALLSMKTNGMPQGRLFQTETNLKQAKWSKSYYEPCQDDIVAIVPEHAKDVLSVGCGWGATEAKLAERGIRVVGIPLDSIIAVCARAKGVEVVPPDFDKAIETLADRRFDCIVFSNVLQHLRNPADILSKYTKLLAEDGVIVVSAPNFNHIKAWRDSPSKSVPYRDERMFDGTQLHFTTKRMVKKWFQQSGMETACIKYGLNGRYGKAARLSLGMFNDLLASNLILVGKKI